MCRIGVFAAFRQGGVGEGPAFRNSLRTNSLRNQAILGATQALAKFSAPAAVSRYVTTRNVR
jgi:hypothetical protein